MDECSHDPCYLTYTKPPAEPEEWPSSLRTPNPTAVFMCPTAMTCHDPDQENSDDYICTCASCADTVFASSTVSLIGSHFDDHPGYAKHLVGMIDRAHTDHSVCATDGTRGCTDAAAYNFDP